jgi:hypothetical protein
MSIDLVADVRLGRVPTGPKPCVRRFRFCAGFRTPGSREPPHDEVAGGRKAPRHEVAGSWARAGVLDVGRRGSRYEYVVYVAAKNCQHIGGRFYCDSRTRLLQGKAGWVSLSAGQLNRVQAKRPHAPHYDGRARKLSNRRDWQAFRRNTRSLRVD